MPVQAIANIGTVIGVKQGAKITRAGNSQPLESGMEVVSGDAISTDGNGLVQLVFVDETKIAIGPNASMVLDVTMLRGNRKAKSFAVQALGGSFRFISGKSKKRAYSITTPTATMAVRGTTFDMWVVPGTQSAMLVLEGKVEMCSLSGSCRSTGRQCSLFATTQSGQVGRPADQQQYEMALQNGFPFIQSQERLLAPLQVDIGGCTAEAVPITPKSDAIEPVEIRSEREAQPEPESPRPQRSEPAREAPREAPSRPEPKSQAPDNGRGNGGNIGGNSGGATGGGGNIGGAGGGDGGGGSIGTNGGAAGSGGSIGGGGGGAPGDGGTIGDAADSNAGAGSGNGPNSGSSDGNGGNFGGN
ncbi:FecR domain-containing protein [Ruegeria sp. THAF57]|uniref:FecR family protein n=1 Tax=Ruegeria sp. THAF57 TaxID=2744555 RepID=UPI001C60D5C7|nr:FecR domain-containing protein [Ruegeria sp. THAF57]